MKKSLLKELRAIPPVPTTDYGGPKMEEREWILKEAERIINKYIRNEK